ncbi:MarR family winged helix-turn-helix transcriptional regulator [Streptomyces sp. CBMA29]|uniref:MarR family winged helix-turn-helix transcriptional regulator n=1 Tax=Streptomyces sp. CBMA29 TaxID=1896314 RepID=UPI001CB75B71|nr:MarR family transcriptional regulator [Streptomyces sp. CBMA29]
MERLERELMLVARHHVLTRRDSSAERLDKSAYLLLARLDSEGPMSIGQLADAFALDTSTVNRQTAALLRSGLAERVPDPEGGLARKLRITEEGAKRLAADREFYIAGIDSVLTDWSPQDVELLSDMLARFNRSIESREGRQWPQP